MADAPREVWIDWADEHDDPRTEKPQHGEDLFAHYIRADLAEPQVPRGATLKMAKVGVQILAVTGGNPLADVMEMWTAMYDAAPAPEEGGIAAKYNELIMAVARKFPDQTRHQTALRYIQQAEAAARTESGAAQTDRALKRDPK